MKTISKLSAIAVLGWVFYAFPQIDLKFSELFFNQHGGFLIADRGSLTILRWTTVVFINGSVLLFIANLLWRRSFGPLRLLPSNGNVIFLLLTLALGPGLLVNSLLKSYSGRARPYEVIRFGGRKEFSPAFARSEQCQRNCSFVSGDAALGYFVLAFTFVLSKRRRAAAFAGIFLGSAIGLFRIAQGAHFLSDVVFAAVATYLVAWLLSAASAAAARALSKSAYQSRSVVGSRAEMKKKSAYKAFESFFRPRRDEQIPNVRYRSFVAFRRRLSRKPAPSRS